MISVWWGVKGVVHWELLPEKSTITASTYRTQLIKLSTKLKDNRTEKGKIYFQHDNARPHIAKEVKRTNISKTHIIIISDRFLSANF